jgi:hypothetical protein
MKLTYRGVSYDYTPNPVPKKGSVIGTGTYRGAAVTFNALAEQPPQPSADLIWRGVPYSVGTPATVAAPVVEVPVAAPAVSEPAAPVAAVAETNTGVVDLARNLFIRHHQRMRRREQGMMVRLAAEVGIPVEDAAHYESHIQGKLPHDFSGYDRSSTAMS